MLQYANFYAVMKPVSPAVKFQNILHSVSIYSNENDCWLLEKFIFFVVYMSASWIRNLTYHANPLVFPIK